MPIYMGIFEKPNVLARGLKGEVKAKGYEGWIELQSAQIAMGRHITSPTGRGSSREGTSPALQEIVVTKLHDSVSAALFRETVQGTGKLIVIVFAKDAATPYLRLVLQDTLISSYSVSGHGGDSGTYSQPMESLSLNFTTVTYETLPQSPDTTHSQMYQLSQQPSWSSYP